MKLGTNQKSLFLRHGCPLAKLLFASDLMTLDNSDSVIHGLDCSTSFHLTQDFCQGHLNGTQVWPSSCGTPPRDPAIVTLVDEPRFLDLGDARIKSENWRVDTNEV